MAFRHGRSREVVQAPPGVGEGSFPESGIVLETERLRPALESPGELLARVEALSPAEEE